MQELLPRKPQERTTPSSPCDEQVRDLLLKIVGSLVDQPDKVELILVTGDEGVAFQMRSTTNNLVQLVGRNGRTARAIRTVLCASGSRNGRKYTLDIVL